MNDLTFLFISRSTKPTGSPAYPLAGIRRTKTDNISLHNPGQQVTRIDIDSQDVRFLTAAVGIITVWTTNYITQDTQKTVLKICYMDIYQKRNNQWKAVAAHVTVLN